MTHPNREVLKAFGLGKLNAATSDTILQHLDTCPECQSVVAEASGDSFLGRLREARKPDGAAIPGMPAFGYGRSLNVPGAAKGSPTAKSLPPELANNSEYQNIEELGRGGMGVVYKAHNTLMGRDEVLKVMGKEVMARPGAIDRFRREIQSAARLDHPNIVRAYSARLIGELLVFSMEYVQGEELGKLVKTRSSLPVTNACYYVQQVANGLQHAHEKGMVHRDIKPANLILHVDREKKKHTVKILDFGLAKLTSEAGFDGRLTGEGRMLGTPDYIAPEQILDAQSADIRADIYSLGCTLYFLLVGHPPFQASSLYELLRQHQEINAPPLNLIRKEVPMELAGVVAKMMAKNPARRFQAPVDVAGVLVPFVKSGVLSTQPCSVETFQLEVPKNLENRRINPSPTPGKNEDFKRATQPQKEVSQREEVTLTPSTTAMEVAWTPIVTVPVSQAALPTAAAPAVSDWGTVITDSTIDSDLQENPASREKDESVPQKWVWPIIVVGAIWIFLVVFVVGVIWEMMKVGIILLENLPSDGEVLVDGNPVEVNRDGGQAKVIMHRSGPHQLKVVQDSKEVFSSDLLVNIGGEPVRICVEIKPLPPPKPIPPPKTPRTNPDDPSVDDPNFWSTPDKIKIPEINTPPELPPIHEVKQTMHFLSGNSNNKLPLPNKDNQPPLPSKDKTKSGPEAIRILSGHSGVVWRLAFSPDGKHLLSGSNSRIHKIEGVGNLRHGILELGDDNTVRMWEVESGRVVARLEGHALEVTGLAYCPKNNELTAACSSSEFVELFAKPTVVVYKARAILHTFSLPPRPDVCGIAISTDGSKVFACGSNETLLSWDLKTQAELPKLKLNSPGENVGERESRLQCVAFSADRSRVFGGLKTGEIVCWDTTTGNRLKSFYSLPYRDPGPWGDGKRVVSIALSPDEKQLVSSSEDYGIRVWNLGTCKQEHLLVGHENAVERFSFGERRAASVIFSPDGRRVISGGADSMLRVWDAATGQPLLIYKGHLGGILAVAISPDGRMIATGGSDKTIRLWKLP